MTSLSGVVKAVPSGDTVIVMGVDASRGPPPEKQITLSGLEAPRLGNRNGPTADAPWAWASREHLRQRAVGKRVTFKIEGAAPSGTREFGTVWLEDGTSLRDVQLTAGWAKLKDKRGGAADAEAAGLARVQGEAAGSIALRPREDNIGEVKRLYVRPGFRGYGLGRRLVGDIVAFARAAGSASLRLDTIRGLMAEAEKLYQSVGFRACAACYENPIEGAVYYELNFPQEPSRD